ncbi:hypothetical protein BaRGS_00033478 [Batillaria attramentaria]|uniref:Uncharacterized protein n=1 Tax=Batillaria attramentaria TaxID=370345 RepID=A0ABD0JLA1_9CAEN
MQNSPESSLPTQQEPRRHSHRTDVLECQTDTEKETPAPPIPFSVHDPEGRRVGVGGWQEPSAAKRRREGGGGAEDDDGQRRSWRGVAMTFIRVDDWQKRVT